MWFTHGAGGDVWVGTRHPEACYKWTAWRTKDKAAALWAAQGVDTPPRRSQMMSDMWHDPKINPPHIEPFIEAADKGHCHAWYFIPAKAQHAIMAAFQQIFAEGKPVEQVFKETNDNITAILKETQKWKPG